jgi:hypothetical protein
MGDTMTQHQGDQDHGRVAIAVHRTTSKQGAQAAWRSLFLEPHPQLSAHLRALNCEPPVGGTFGF